MSSILDTQPQPDEQLEAIAHTARRRLLVTLLDDYPHGDTPIEITEWVNGSAVDLTVMHHSHLPKLEARGFIRWDRDHDHVFQGPQFAEIEPLLTLIYDHRSELPDEWL